MTLYVVISDVHSNYQALLAVEADAHKAAKADALQFICLGDMVDYGPQPNECMDWLLERMDRVIVVQGNHDRAVINPSSNLHCINKDYRPIMLWTWKVLETRYQEMMTAWQHERRFLSSLRDFTIFHGSLIWQDGRIDSPGLAKMNFKQLKTRYALFGHTHHQGCFIKKPYKFKSWPPAPVGEGVVCSHREVSFDANGWRSIPEGEWLSLEAQGQALLINPGSVGQPRRHPRLMGSDAPQDNRAAYMLLDPEKGRFQFRRVEYDYKETIRQLRERVFWPVEPQGHSIFKDEGMDESLFDNLNSRLRELVEKTLIPTLQSGQSDLC